MIAIARIGVYVSEIYPRVTQETTVKICLLQFLVLPASGSKKFLECWCLGKKNLIERT
jgi:hypothetical protein